MSATLRVAVVGGGLIAQAMHLPNLAHLADEFELVAVADVSANVAVGLGLRYSATPYTDWRDLLEQERLDAVLVCSPHATHAEITLAALDRGLAVFVEKPLCIDPQDADRICRRSAATGLVVQVGYMKRFAPAYEALLEGLPASTDRLRLVSVVTYDPWMAREPFVPWNQMIQSNDIPAAVRNQQRESECEQVRAAVGHGDDGTVRAYSYTFLACLIHDVNLVHGALDRLGVDAPLVPLMAADWADGHGGSLAVRLPNGALAQFAWVLLSGLTAFREQATLYFEDAVHELRFPCPYDRDAPVRYSVTAAHAGNAVREFKGDAFASELRHFHDCVVHRLPCRCPPEQAARDIKLLRDLFVSGTMPNPTLVKGAQR
jgi:predicted dehydrogenase